MYIMRAIITDQRKHEGPCVIIIIGCDCRYVYKYGWTPVVIDKLIPRRSKWIRNVG